MMLIKKAIPNLISCMSAFCAFASIYVTISTNFDISVSILLVCLAGFLDGCDGRVARKLGVFGNFGVQLDSLIDLISFGIAPIFIMFVSFTWKSEPLTFLCLAFYSVCMAIRLARFNCLALNPKKTEKMEFLQKNFFIGVPAPAGAIILVLPVIANSIGLVNYNSTTPLLAYILIVALMLVMPFPTFSPKSLRIGFRDITATITTFTACSVLAFFIIRPMLCLLILFIIYLASIPFAGLIYRRWVKIL